MNNNIRPIQKNDYDSFLKLIDEFYHSEAVLHPVDPKNYSVTFDRCINADPFTACYVYDQDGTINGYALLSFAYSNEVGGIVVWIEELYVPAEHRGKGIGTALMNFVHNTYMDSAKRFRLEATHGNEKAIALYRSIGYEPLDYLQMTKDL